MRSLLALLVSSLFCASTCLAQVTASAHASISVNIVKGISTTSASGLSFGAIPAGSGTHTVSPAAPSAGSFAIDGQAGANVSVRFPSTVPLQNGSGHTLSFNPSIPIWNTSRSQTDGEREFEDVTGGTGTLSSTGQLYVWFGGSINTDSAPVGSYSGDYTITITY